MPDQPIDTAGSGLDADLLDGYEKVMDIFDALAAEANAPSNLKLYEMIQALESRVARLESHNA